MTTGEVRTFLEGCLERGLTTFDLADIYGDYSTEALFGEALREMGGERDHMQLIGKYGIKLPCNQRPDYRCKSYDTSRDHLTRSVDQSLRHLHTDHLDLLLIHRPDLLLDPNGVAETFTRLQESGKVRFFGVSNFSPAQFAALHSHFPLITNQVEASINHLGPFLDGTFDQCLKYRIHPMVWSPLGGGRIWTDEGPRALRIRQAANELTEKYDTSLSTLLITWLLKHPVGLIPILGTTRLGRVDQAIQALSLQIDREDWYYLLEAARDREVA